MASEFYYAVYFRFNPIENYLELEQIEEFLNREFKSRMLRKLDYLLEEEFKDKETNYAKFEVRNTSFGRFVFSYCKGNRLEPDEKRFISKKICNIIEEEINDEFKIFLVSELKRNREDISYRDLLNPDEDSIEEV